MRHMLSFFPSVEGEKCADLMRSMREMHFARGTFGLISPFEVQKKKTLNVLLISSDLLVNKRSCSCLVMDHVVTNIKRSFFL